MTAHALAHVQKQAEEAGMNGYITKPLNINKLQETLTRVMSKSQG
jgi:CheY-like chemotaxis protein